MLRKIWWLIIATITGIAVVGYGVFPVDASSLVGLQEPFPLGYGEDLVLLIAHIRFFYGKIKGPSEK